MKQNIKVSVFHYCNLIAYKKLLIFHINLMFPAQMIVFNGVWFRSYWL